jgi:hypothetical protein
MRRLVTITAVAVAGTIALAACGGGVGDAGSSPEPPDTAQPGSGSTSDNEAGDEETRQFLGLTLDEAASLGEQQGRQWRVGRRDGEDLALTADLVDGRVTFEIEEGVVTAATVEQADAATEPGEIAPEDEERAELLAGAVERIVTVDNSFGGGDPCDRIEVATVVGGDPARPVEPLALELIAKSLEPVAAVEFIDDAQAAIEQYFEAAPQGVAVVSIDDVRIGGERAEVDLLLWCGNLCAVALTYEAELGPDGWRIIGTAGPVAIS